MSMKIQDEKRDQSRAGAALGVVAAVVMVAIAVVAVVTERWVLTAAPVGLLFGFFLQKGDLCGASAMSEVIALRDGRKLFGVWKIARADR